MMSETRKPKSTSAKELLAGVERAREAFAEAGVRVIPVEEQEQIKQYSSEAAVYIMEVLLPEWRELFLRKHAGYGQMHHDLGMLGQAVDIHRKAGKLKRALIEGKPIGPESVREVAMDLIGHAFLLMEVHDSPQQGEFC